MSRLVWQYEGANVEKHGEQCVFVGDKVHHDILGEGIAVRIDGGMIIIEFLEDGERIEKHQTKGHVYALEQRERAQQKRTGRRPEGQVGLLASLFGREHEAPVGAEAAKKRHRRPKGAQGNCGDARCDAERCGITGHCGSSRAAGHCNTISRCHTPAVTRYRIAWSPIRFG